MKLQQSFRFDSALPSPPSRGAWIEITDTFRRLIRLCKVAPLAGGVD